MFYSYSIEEHLFSVFKLFIECTLKGNNSYKKEIDAVVSEAKSLINNEKSIYEIDRKEYPVILFLAETGKDFLNNVDISNLSNNDYKKLLLIFEKQRNLCLV